MGSVLTWSETQYRRLRELGGDDSVFEQNFPSRQERDSGFQEIEKKRVKSQKAKLQALLSVGGKTQLETLCDALSRRLVSLGFVKVVTPTVISRHALEKMTIDTDHPLSKQVYWINEKQCLRPMLAPNLYSLMQDFTRQKQRPVRFFEIGSCFRKETDGANHTSEFTMLNLVEMGVPMDERERRLRDFGQLIATAAGVTDYRFVTEDSEVYGSTLDIVGGPDSVEIGSGAIGPHPLDSNWGIHETWVGLGAGLERLMMLARGETTISRWCRSLSYFDGIRLKV